MKKLLLSVLAVTAIVLTGCDKKQSGESVIQPQKQQGTITERTQNIEYIQSLLKNTHNFNSGKVNENLNKKIIVFFDPQCIHCSKLFLNSQTGDNKDINVVWIPVGFLNEKSIPQGATILASENPFEAMKSHEASFSSGQSGINFAMISSENLNKIQINNDFFSKTGASGVPYILKLDKDGNKLITSGELTPEYFKDFYEK